MFFDRLSIEGTGQDIAAAISTEEKKRIRCKGEDVGRVRGCMAVDVDVDVEHLGEGEVQRR